MNATLEIVCYKSKTLKDNTDPLMLRISKDGRKKYISIGVSVNHKHWDFTKNIPKSSCPNRNHLNKLILAKKGQYHDKIIELAAQQKEYSPQTLVETVENRVKSKTLRDRYGVSK